MPGRTYKHDTTSSHTATDKPSTRQLYATRWRDQLWLHCWRSMNKLYFMSFDSVNMEKTVKKNCESFWPTWADTIVAFISGSADLRYQYTLWDYGHRVNVSRGVPVYFQLSQVLILYIHGETARQIDLVIYQTGLSIWFFCDFDKPLWCTTLRYQKTLVPHPQHNYTDWYPIPSTTTLTETMWRHEDSIVDWLEEYPIPSTTTLTETMW